MRVSIENGRVIDPANSVNDMLNVYINNGKIVGVQNKLENFESDVTIDAKDAIVCPGFIELGAEFGALIADESKFRAELFAAAAGGFTTVCVNPTTNCYIDNIEMVEKIISQSGDNEGADVICIGALTTRLKGEALTEMYGLKTAGCSGFSNGRIPIVDSCILKNAFLYASTLELPIFISPKDHWLSRQGVMRDGASSVSAGLPGISRSCELIGLSRELTLLNEADGRGHVKNLSTGDSTSLIKDFNNENFTSDVSIYHLCLNDSLVNPFDSNFNFDPPLPSISDQERLIRQLESGEISSLSSAHTPLKIEEKATTFENSKPGSSGFDTFAGLMCSLVETNKVSIENAIAAITEKPAIILGKPEKGTLSCGTSADICVFDPSLLWKVSPEKIMSNGKNTPFLNKQLKGKVIHTILNGKPIYQSKSTN